MKRIIYIFLSLFFLVFLCFLFLQNYNKISKLIPDAVKETFPKSILNFHENVMTPLVNIKNALLYRNYFFNALFLPESHFANLELNRISLNNNKNPLKESKFYIDTLDENIVITTDNLNIFYVNKDKLVDNNSITLSQINTNLNEKFSSLTPLDAFIDSDKNYFYISGYTIETDDKDKRGCKLIHLLEAKFNFKKIEFQEIYNTEKCARAYFMQGGRIQKYNHNNSDGLLFSLAENEIDIPNNNPQDDSSDYGKIIFLDLNTKETLIFSKGHRNPQGLYVEGTTIIATEHGPRGGDEINKIIKGKNYGWPLSSYGNYYNTDKKKYFKSHKKYGFKEPIFTFIPAIGISEIVKIPKEFIKEEDLNNIFFISSLNGRSLYLTKFEENYEKIIFSEKIFINQRIRDIKYIDKYNVFILSLEKPYELAVLKKLE